MPRINSPQEARAQFDTFTSYARTIGDRTAVQVGHGPGPLCTITAKSKFDFIGNIGRRQQSRNTNNDVRDLFKETVVKMFGGQNKDDVARLPAPVREAMKLDDYGVGAGKGKPLTARRIIAVQMAVKQHELETKIGTDLGINLSADKVLQERIHTAVEACKGNEDAFAVLKESYREILFENNASSGGPLSGEALRPRGNWAIRSKMSAIISDLRTLRQATGQDQGLFDAAKPFLALTDRAPLSSALLTGMVTAVKQLQPADLAPLSTLGANSHGEAIHKAAVKLTELVNGAMARSGLGRPRNLLQTRRSDYREQLLASMILAKAIPNKAALRNVQALLQSNEAGGLRRLYKQSYALVDPHANIVSNDLQGHVAEVCMHLEFSLDALKRAADQMCDGVLSEERPVDPVNGLIDTNNPAAQTIQRDILASARAVQTAAFNAH